MLPPSLLFSPLPLKSSPQSQTASPASVPSLLHREVARQTEMVAEPLPAMEDNNARVIHVIALAALLLLIIAFCICCYFKIAYGSLSEGCARFGFDDGTEVSVVEIGGAVGGEEDEEEGSMVNATIPETIKAYVELDGQVHCVVLPLTGIKSWGALSQLVHEACEDSGVPNLPVHGVMHIVLNVGDKPVPVTASTRLVQLHRAKALRVTIGADSRDSTSKRTKAKGGSNKYQQLDADDDGI